MGYDIPHLTQQPDSETTRRLARARARIATLLPDEELAQLSKAVVYELVEDETTYTQRYGDAEVEVPYVDAKTRLAASVALNNMARGDLALAGPGKARTAAEMLEAIRRAIPELERRAAVEAGQAVPKDEGGEW